MKKHIKSIFLLLLANVGLTCLIDGLINPSLTQTECLYRIPQTYFYDFSLGGNKKSGQLPECDEKGFAIMYLPPWKGCNVYDLERRDTLGYGYDHRGFTKEEVLEIELREQEKVVCLCECRCDSSIAVPNNGTFKGKTTGNNSPLIISNGDVNINFE